MIYSLQFLLVDLLSRFSLKLWNILGNHQNTFNQKTSIFSYETVANFHYEICSLYLNLVHNQKSIVVSANEQIKTLLNMVDQFCFVAYSSTTHDPEDNHNQSTLVRLKFLDNVLNDQVLLDVCKKHLPSFQNKIINTVLMSYLNISKINPTNDGSDMSHNYSSANKNLNLIEKELVSILKQSVNELPIFLDLNINFSSSVEQFFDDFISRYGLKLEKAEVKLNNFIVNQLFYRFYLFYFKSFAERKLFLENYISCFQDFSKLIYSLNSIGSHVIIYKIYMVASQIVFKTSVYLHIRVRILLLPYFEDNFLLILLSKGKSDTLFAKIIDKMILQVIPNKSSSAGNMSKLNNASSLVHSNNQNSILMSLKDTLYKVIF